MYTFAAMKNKFNIISFISLLGLLFVLTQDIVNYCISTDETMNMELTETGSEEERFEKEIKYLVTSGNTDSLSNTVLTQLKHNIDFLNSLYSNPFIQKDIKPPHMA